MKKKLAIAIVLVLITSACGIKPRELNAPADVEKDTFPRTYPDIETDPE